MNTDEDNSGQSGTDTVHSFTQVISFVVLLNVVDHQRAILDLDVGVVRFEILVIARLNACEVHTPTLQAKLRDEDKSVTGGLFPRDHRLGETVRFAFDSRVGALGKGLVGRFQDPPRWH